MSWTLNDQCSTLTPVHRPMADDLGQDQKSDGRFPKTEISLVLHMGFKHFIKRMGIYPLLGNINKDVVRLNSMKI